MVALIGLALFAFFGVLLLGRKYFWILVGTLLVAAIVLSFLERHGLFS